MILETALRNYRTMASEQQISDKELVHYMDKNIREFQEIIHRIKDEATQ